MPNRKRDKSMRSNRPAKRRNQKGNRGSSRFQHSSSILVTTLQTKQSHKKEEVYPIPLNRLISRNNVGVDAEVRLVGYTMSCQLATGNDCSTVSLNVAHSGPWVREGLSADKFDQQFVEHTVRGKSCLFKKAVIPRSELEYLNPDTSDNYINLRVRDPCGVIPGVVIRIEFRAHLIRRTPQSTFDDPTGDAVDKYEDQDVSAGSSSGQPAPAPPAAVKHAPQVIALVSGDITVKDTGSRFEYAVNSISGYRVTYTSPKQVVSGRLNLSTFPPPSGSALQTKYNSDGFDGTITEY